MSANTLALLGGTPVNTKSQPRYNTIGNEEKQAVLNILESGELSGFVAAPGDWFFGGKSVRALEESFKTYFGTRHAIAVNSATSGLHAALMAMDLGPGDEVIVPPYTMHASATMVVMCGAVPIFADIEDSTFCIDPNAVEALINPRTQGIVAVNLFGHPAQLDPLKAICDKHGLFLIEDNAQAPDAEYFGRKTGTIGHAGVFSFNRHKTIQCGEGGIVVTNDDRVAKKVSLFRNHGETVVDAWGETDLVNTLGVNYRMGEMEAAVAQVQFRRLSDLNRQRIVLANHFRESLSEVDFVHPPVVADNCSHVYYFFGMRFDEESAGVARDLFAEAVQAEGFPVRSGYLKPLYLEPMYQRKVAIGRSGFPWSAHPGGGSISYKRGICPVVERVQEKELLLTSYIHPPLGISDIDRFVEAIDKVSRNISGLRALERSSGATF